MANIVKKLTCSKRVIHDYGDKQVIHCFFENLDRPAGSIYPANYYSIPEYLNILGNYAIGHIMTLEVNFD